MSCHLCEGDERRRTDSSRWKRIKIYTLSAQGYLYSRSPQDGQGFVRESYICICIIMNLIPYPHPMSSKWGVLVKRRRKVKSLWNREARV